MTHNDRIQNLHDQITAVHDALHKSLENFQSLVQPVVPTHEEPVRPNYPFRQALDRFLYKWGCSESAYDETINILEPQATRVDSSTGVQEDSLAEMTHDRDEWYEQYYDILCQRDDLQRTIDDLQQDLARTTRERDEWDANATEEAERAADTIRDRDELNRSLDAVQEDLARVTQERDRLQDRIDTAIQELTRWHPNRQAAVDALTDYEPGDEDDEFDPQQFEQGVQRTQAMPRPSRTVRWARYTPEGTVYRVFGFRGNGEYDVYGLDGIRRTLHGDDLEPWHPRDGEWITGENWTRTSLVTGTYDSTYRTHAAPEGCVAVCVRPSVYVWAHLDSLYPVRGGDQG